MADFETLPLRRHLLPFKSRINSVIDVGVRQGTPPLYRALRGKKFYLVDPQVDGEDLLIYRPPNYEFINLGLGASEGEMDFVEADAKSSFLERTELTANKTETRHKVRVTTLDSLIDDHGIEGPIALKIDTEGYEIEVMKGLNKHADKVDLIICEASVRRRFVDSYNFSDLVRAMDDQGFVFFNFLGKARMKPRFYDVMFLPRNHPFFD